MTRFPTITSNQGVTMYRKMTDAGLWYVQFISRYGQILKSLRLVPEHEVKKAYDEYMYDLP